MAPVNTKTMPDSNEHAMSNELRREIESAYSPETGSNFSLRTERADRDTPDQQSTSDYDAKRKIDTEAAHAVIDTQEATWSYNKQQIERVEQSLEVMRNDKLSEVA